MKKVKINDIVYSVDYENKCIDEVKVGFIGEDSFINMYDIRDDLIITYHKYSDYKTKWFDTLDEAIEAINKAFGNGVIVKYNNLYEWLKSAEEYDADEGGTILKDYTIKEVA